jgi:hypothetical protein
MDSFALLWPTNHVVQSIRKVTFAHLKYEKVTFSRCRRVTSPLYQAALHQDILSSRPRTEVTLHTDRIEAALDGRLSLDALTSDELAVWLDAFGAKMSKPTPEEEAFFAERRRRGVGVGITENGRLVRAKDRLGDDVIRTPCAGSPERDEPTGSDCPDTLDD